jgi:hypothetical protein
MIELFKSLTDDQKALFGCAAALSLAGTIMSLSYYIGRGRIAALGRKAGQPEILASQGGQLVPSAVPVTASDRRNAA